MENIIHGNSDSKQEETGHLTNAEVKLETGNPEKHDKYSTPVEYAINTLHPEGKSNSTKI